jgi:hypothetical protein
VWWLSCGKSEAADYISILSVINLALYFRRQPVSGWRLWCWHGLHKGIVTDHKLNRQWSFIFTLKILSKHRDWDENNLLQLWYTFRHKKVGLDHRTNYTRDDLSQLTRGDERRCSSANRSMGNSFPNTDLASGVNMTIWVRIMYDVSFDMFYKEMITRWVELSKFGEPTACSVDSQCHVLLWNNYWETTTWKCDRCLCTCIKRPLYHKNTYTHVHAFSGLSHLTINWLTSENVYFSTRSVNIKTI